MIIVGAVNSTFAFLDFSYTSIFSLEYDWSSVRYSNQCCLASDPDQIVGWDTVSTKNHHRLLNTQTTKNYKRVKPQKKIIKISSLYE